MLNLISLGLGVLACLFPIICIMNHLKGKFMVFLTTLSYICCSTSLLLQLLEIKWIVDKNDFSSLLDTMWFIVTISIVLVVVVATLNIIACFLSLTKVEKIKKKNKTAEVKEETEEKKVEKIEEIVSPSIEMNEVNEEKNNE